MAHQNRTNDRSFSFEMLRVSFRTLSRISPSLAARAGARLFLRTRRYPAPERELSLLAGATEGFVDTSEGRLPTWTWGASGPTVLLVHGWEGRGSQLAPFAAPLVSAGFRVVAFDAPGHGKAPGDSSSIVALARALEAVSAETGPAAGVIAHSAGAVATTFALSRGLSTDRVVFVAPGAGVLDYSRQFARVLGIGEETRRRLQERIEQRIGVAWEAIEPVPLARTMDRPLLVLSDRDDREATLPSVEVLAGAWTGARLEVTKGLGHRRILRNRHVVEQAVVFLSEDEIPEESAGQSRFASDAVGEADPESLGRVATL